MNKDDLQALRNAYAIAVEDNKVLKDRLKKIKEFIQYCQSLDFCDECKYIKTCVGRFNFEELILNIIEGAEDDKTV